MYFNFSSDNIISDQLSNILKLNDFSLNSGQKICVLGENGSGKTLLANTILS